MYYWNRDNFEGLAAVAAAASVAGIPTTFVSYCTLRSDGQRASAFAALRSFLEEAKLLTSEERRRIVSWLLEAQASSPTVHQLLPHPLLKELVEPTLEEWLVDCPNDSVANCWTGYVFRDQESLRLALRTNAQNSIARRLLLSELLSDVEFSTHHLVESKFLGAEAEASANLAEARKHLAESPDGASWPDLEARAAEQHRLLIDWQEYSQRPVGTFPQWCSERARVHCWPSIAHYS